MCTYPRIGIGKHEGSVASDYLFFFWTYGNVIEIEMLQFLLIQNGTYCEI